MESSGDTCRLLSNAWLSCQLKKGLLLLEGSICVLIQQACVIPLRNGQAERT